MAKAGGILEMTDPINPHKEAAKQDAFLFGDFPDTLPMTSQTDQQPTTKPCDDSLKPSSPPSSEPPVDSLPFSLPVDPTQQ